MQVISGPVERHVIQALGGPLGVAEPPDNSPGSAWVRRDDRWHAERSGAERLGAERSGVLVHVASQALRPPP